MNIVMVRPGAPATLGKIEPTLEAMQHAVGGYIEAVHPFQDDPSITLICNEEGKLRGLPRNRFVMRRLDDDLVAVDLICGDFFFCRQDGEELVGLTEEQITQLLAVFGTPNKWEDEA